MLRSTVKSLAFRSGAMDLLHGLRNRESLTVVMLHRVLPSAEQIQFGADPTYAVTPEFLRACLEFIKKRYAIVSLGDVLLSRRGITPLPSWPALITFDDGWQDNVDWAVPALGDTPWTLFVATDAAATEGAWWQEVLLWSLRSGESDFAGLCALARNAHAVPKDADGGLPEELRVLLLFGQLGQEQRQAVLAPLEAAMKSRGRVSRMLRQGELKRLSEGAVSIGAHGASHLPLTHLPDATQDMKRARDWLLDVIRPDGIQALSFPHGRWNSRLVEAARGLGFELLFTSDAVLNPCPSGWLQGDVIARIPLATHDLSDARGNLAPERISGWLRRVTRQPVEA